MTKGLHKGSLRKVDNPHQWMIDDAKMELIQQIKAEVEKLYDGDAPKHDPDWKDGYFVGIAKMLNILDTLQEKSEKPINPVCEELDDDSLRVEFKKIDHQCFEEGVVGWQKEKLIARHFYELGRQSECVKVKAESALDKFMLENCTHCLIEHCPGMRECYTSSNKQLQ